MVSKDNARVLVSENASLTEVKHLIETNQIDRAVEIATRELANGRVESLYLNLRSYRFSQLGREDEALADLEHALALAPNDVHARNAYATLLGKRGAWEDAAQHYELATQTVANFAPAIFGLGWVAESTGELNQARSYFEAAARIAPHFVEPIVHLANLAARRSDWNGAEVLSNKALSIDPRNYAARACLANVAIARGQFEQAEVTLRTLLAAKAPGAYDAAFARGLLGDLRHAQKRYTQAFAAYSSCNREQFALYRRRFDLSEMNATSYCRWLADRFSHETVTAEEGGTNRAASHVFLVGFPRSGTTLLENVLASNPVVEALEERDTLGELTRRYLADADGLARFHALSGDELEKARALYWDRVQRYTGDLNGKCLLDKYPLSAMKLPLVAKLFPNAKILFAVRDPRDVVLSCFRRMFNMNTSMFELLDLERAAQFYDAVMDLSMIYRERLKLAWCEVRHESLVADFETETRRICSFIGIQWDAAMADFAERAKKRTIRTPSSTQVVRGLNSDSVGQWRNYARQLSPAFPILERWVEHWNYPAD